MPEDNSSLNLAEQAIKHYHGNLNHTLKKLFKVKILTIHKTIKRIKG